jgi:hypothetical protein
MGFWILIVLGKVLGDNIKTSVEENLVYHKLKRNKSWFDECSKLMDQRKQAKLQWLQNLRHDTSRSFRKKEREHLKDKINEFETSNRTKNIKISVRRHRWI